MTQEDRRFLEQIDLLRMQGSSVSDLQNTETQRRMTAISTSLDTVESDLWTQAVRACADGNARAVLQAYSVVKASDMDPETKMWLETLLLCALEKTSEEALQSIAGGNALPAPAAPETVGGYARILARQELMERRRARNILQAKLRKREMEKEAQLRKRAGRAQDELAQAQRDLNNHMTGGMNGGMNGGGGTR